MSNCFHKRFLSYKRINHSVLPLIHPFHFVKNCGGKGDRISRQDEQVQRGIFWNCTDISPERLGFPHEYKAHVTLGLHKKLLCVIETVFYLTVSLQFIQALAFNVQRCIGIGMCVNFVAVYLW